MNASKLHPNMWKGEELNGGYIGKNSKPLSAKAPHYKGRLYLKGIGWLWLSGWDRKGAHGTIVSLRASAMTDDDVRRYVLPSDTNGLKEGDSQPAPARGNGTESQDNEIPF